MPLSRTEPVHFCPGITGGNEWNGAAFNPATNMLYTGAVDWCATVQLQAEVEVPGPGAIWFGSSDMQTSSDVTGWLRAFDADTGVLRWEFKAPAPVVAGVTPTAGGLVFTADLDGSLKAFDAESGAVLWNLDAGESIGGGIVSYMAGGRQLIGVASGMRSLVWPERFAAEQSRIRVFGLP